MTTQFEGASLTDAIIAILTAASFVVGDGEAPAAGGWSGAPLTSTYVPYVNVHAVPGGLTDGPISLPDVDAGADYILISVGATRGQAEAVGDDVRALMLTAAVTLLNSRSVVHRRIEMLGGAVRDDTVLPPVWFVSDRYRFLTVPS